MICTVCCEPFDEQDTHKYAVVLAAPGGFTVRMGCSHKPIPTEGADAVIGSTACLQEWVAQYMQAHHQFREKSAAPPAF